MTSNDSPPPPGAFPEGTPLPGLPSPGLPSPGLPSPGLPSPGLPSPGLPSPGLPSPGLPSPGLPSPGLPSPGLPPVTPPSGRFIAQLFLVPGMIVLVAVLIILGVNYLFVGGYTPQYFLAKLDSDNDDIRWRGASDLAQHIKRPENKNLKADAGFALELAQRLHDRLEELRTQTKEMAPRVAKLPADEQDKEWRKLSKRLDYVEFLISALGDFYVPVGVPLLCEIMNQAESADATSNMMLRRRAVWALANLGDHVKSAAKQLAPEQLAAIIEELKKQLERPDSAKRTWARTALFYLGGSAPMVEGAEVVLVDRELARCAGAKDEFLRLQVAMALNFWDGALVEETLVRLAHDDGFGVPISNAAQENQPD